MNELENFNIKRRVEVERICSEKVLQHERQKPVEFEEYPLRGLLQAFRRALNGARRYPEPLDVRLELIDRERFDADITLKFPGLLANGGPKEFVKRDAPWIVAVLQGAEFSAVIAKVSVKGMYINITLSDSWILSTADSVLARGDAFGSSNAMASRTFVVDYSSPNIAKVLHAGHIRSTIIGHVVCNLLEASGALVYRVNHINDYGGFGFMLDGYRRFAARFPAEMSGHERLIGIYRLRRSLERLAMGETLDADDASFVCTYLTRQEMQDPAALYSDYVREADKRFASLEKGDAEEVGLWAKMVQWSMQDFQSFYDALDIHIDIVLGESFYALEGQSVVDEGLKRGTAIIYTADHAARDRMRFDRQLQEGLITQEARGVLIAESERDVDATVVPLSGGRRFVVRRADGLSIYATRDLGAIALRRTLFKPSDIVYIVGQEQQTHFTDLFEAAVEMGLVRPNEIKFRHVYFGFYVDAATGKKLSSRNSVSSVNLLLSASVAYFRQRTALRGDMTQEEIELAAHQLSIGSVVFNDLKQDVRGSVDIHTEAIDATVAEFEKSGGAYLVYTACRARAILRKFGGTVPHSDEIPDGVLSDLEAKLLLKIQQVPEIVVSGASDQNPTLLIRQLLDLATLYNSYYVKARVIENGAANPARLLITAAVASSLVSALKMCHVECPDKI